MDAFARLQLQMMGAFAKFERNIIRQRQAEGIARAKVKTAHPKPSKPLPTLPIPKSANTPKPTQAAPTQQVSQKDFELIKPQAPIAPK